MTLCESPSPAVALSEIVVVIVFAAAIDSAAVAEKLIVSL